MNWRHFASNCVRNQFHKPKWLPSSQAQILICMSSKVHLIVPNMADGTANNDVLWTINDGRFLSIASWTILLVSLTDCSAHLCLVVHTTAACSHLYWSPSLKLKSIAHENFPVGNLVCTVIKAIFYFGHFSCNFRVTVINISIFCDPLG